MWGDRSEVSPPPGHVVQRQQSPLQYGEEEGVCSGFQERARQAFTNHLRCCSGTGECRQSPGSAHIFQDLSWNTITSLKKPYSDSTYCRNQKEQVHSWSGWDDHWRLSSAPSGHLQHPPHPHATRRVGDPPTHPPVPQPPRPAAMEETAESLGQNQQAQKHFLPPVRMLNSLPSLPPLPLPQIRLLLQIKNAELTLLKTPLYYLEEQV